MEQAFKRFTVIMRSDIIQQETGEKSLNKNVRDSFYEPARLSTPRPLAQPG